MLLAFTRVLKLAFSNFRRNLWLSVATITVMVLAIATYHVVVLLRVASDAALLSIEKKIDVGIYLAPTVSDDGARLIKTTLEKLPTVAEVRLITKAEALEAFRKQRGSSDMIQRALAEVGENPFGAQLRIRAKSADRYPAVIAALDDPAVVAKGSIEQKSYDDHKTLITRFKLLSSKAQQLVQMIGFALLLISFFVVFNTVRIALYTHREEIGIMKLVGASNWFIRLPFLLEGVLLSFIATLLATVLLLGALYAAEPFSVRFFSEVPVNFLRFYQSHALLLIGGQFVVLSIMNVLGASIAIGRYLKV